MKRFFWLTGWMLAAAAVRAEFDAGPLAASRTDAEGTNRLMAFGPLVERVTAPQGAFSAVRPFWSHTVLPEEELEIHEVFWPLYARRFYKEESSWRALLIFTGRRFDVDAEAADRRRTWLLPFWFHGEDAQGEPYRALFPVGGTIREFLGRDEIFFVLFPIYAESRMEEQETLSVLWPVYSRTQGPRDDRFRIFPLYGRSERTDRFRKKFFLWPIWTSAEFTDPAKSGSAWMLFPLAGHGEAGRERTTYVIPPFFRFTRAPWQDTTHCPWPFFQFADGEVRKRYVWPLYGYKRQGPVERTFALWPLLWSQTVRSQDEVVRNRFALPFFYAQTRKAGVAEADGGDAVERTGNYWKLWPLMSWEREGDRTRFRTLELWPLRATEPMERNYAPLWRLYQHRRSETGLEQELLWGLMRSARDEAAETSRFSLFPVYEQSRGGAEREWTLLKGLLGYKSTPQGKSFRLLWLFEPGADVKDNP